MNDVRKLVNLGIWGAAILLMYNVAKNSIEIDKRSAEEERKKAAVKKVEVVEDKIEEKVENAKKKSVLKRYPKGSEETKKRMAELREMGKKVKRGEGKKAMRKKAKALKEKACK